MKKINFKGIEGVVLGEPRKAQKILEGKSLNFYGLRHSDNDFMGHSPATIEKNIVRVNSFGVFVSLDVIDFGESDYFELKGKDKRVFTQAKTNQYTAEEVLSILSR